MPEDYIGKLAAILAGHPKVLILPHNDPDPDAIASAVGLRFLLKGKFQIESTIAYQGFIGRVENQALVQYLGNPLTNINRAHFQDTAAIALVDTQPGAGNNPLPENLEATIVIDHHRWAAASGPSPYVDVRPELGSSSTILTEYLNAAGIEPTTKLATALFYGIKSDTRGLSRNTNPSDVAAYFYLQPRIDVNALVQIEQAQVPLTYFKNIDNALHAGCIYDDDVIITYLGELAYPDQCAEIADLFMRLQGLEWVFCMGVFRDEFVLSVRTLSKSLGAGKLVQDLLKGQGTAGGHGSMAAGHIVLKKGDDPEQIAGQLENAVLLYLKGKLDVSSYSMM